MSKHTPWEIEWGNPIAIGGGISFVPQSLDGTHTANAYLISQAPAMLEALERLIASDDAHATIHAPDGDDVARMLEYAAAFDNARAAIKAAKGEA